MNEKLVNNMNKHRLDTHYPQQVSDDQSSQGKSEIAFSNGFSYLSIDHENKSPTGNDHLFTENSLRNQLRSRAETPVTNAVHVKPSGRPAVPPRYQEYADYSERLRSYARWTKNNPDPTSLSKAGFFFTNQYDLVRCFQCGIGLKNFYLGDDPLEEHVRNFPTCQYLVDYLGKERLSAIKEKFQPTIDSNHEQNTPELFANTHIHEDCRHPEYSSVHSRIATFVRWPRHILQRPQDLAEAGLYYTGIDDQVRCFTCDGGLRRWDPDDDPWTEHCRWFPTCSFARRMKGDELIALIQASTKLTNGDDQSSHTEQIEKSADISSKMEQMTLRDPELQTSLQEHKDTCLEMGFQLKDVNAAAEELIMQGKVKPTIDELIDTIYNRETQLQIEKEQEIIENETPLEENKRLKTIIICTMCGQNNTNALFLPCTHHRFCMECAEPLRRCPVCDKVIRQKIRTYLV